MKTVYYPGPKVRHEHHNDAQTFPEHYLRGPELTVHPGPNALEDQEADYLLQAGAVGTAPLKCDECAKAKGAVAKEPVLAQVAGAPEVVQPAKAEDSTGQVASKDSPRK